MPHHQSPGAPSTSANRTGRLASRPDLSGGSIGQGTPELVARFDTEFDEDLFQVVLDGACAEEQPGADLGIREAIAGQPRDLGLLRGQLIIAGGGAAFECRLGTFGIYVPKRATLGKHEEHYHANSSWGCHYKLKLIGPAFLTGIRQRRARIF
jgi:hypothetical protein